MHQQATAPTVYPLPVAIPLRLGWLVGCMGAKLQAVGAALIGGFRSLEVWRGAMVD